MSAWSLAYEQSVLKRYHGDKHFSEFLPTRWRQKSTETKLLHCHPIDGCCSWDCYKAVERLVQCRTVAFGSARVSLSQNMRTCLCFTTCSSQPSINSALQAVFTMSASDAHTVHASEQSFVPRIYETGITLLLHGDRELIDDLKYRLLRHDILQINASNL